MRRELAILVARSPFGQGAALAGGPKLVQRGGSASRWSHRRSDLPDPLAAEAEQLGLRIADELGVVGVLAVELFETTEGALVVNELAMRPHNSVTGP